MQASLPVVRPNPHAEATACLNEVPRSADDQVLAVQQMDYDGRIQCRVKILRSDGMVQVLTGELSP